MELFCKRYFQVFTIFEESSIIEVWQGPKYLCVRHFEVPSVSAIQNETTAAAFNLLDEVH